jgi:hypothetical protein
MAGLDPAIQSHKQRRLIPLDGRLKAAHGELEKMNADQVLN